MSGVQITVEHDVWLPSPISIIEESRDIYLDDEDTWLATAAILPGPYILFDSRIHSMRLGP